MGAKATGLNEGSIKMQFDIFGNIVAEYGLNYLENSLVATKEYLVEQGIGGKSLSKGRLVRQYANDYGIEI